MPAQNRSSIDEQEIYYHIYNVGIEKRNIFNDKEDYDVFVGYLNDYLTPPKDPNNTKKVFEIRGRTFRGTPHQPKNYYGKVELIAYSLMSNQFHLVLHKINEIPAVNFIGSLCTRYSMYFNKKYQRRGTLFEGPYKSAAIKGRRMMNLTRLLHSSSEYSSYPEYLGQRSTSWVKPQAVLSFFEKGTRGYKDFVEKNKDTLENHIEPRTHDPTAGTDERSSLVRGEHFQRIASKKSEDKEIPLEKDLRSWPKTLGFLAITTTLFIVLTGLGLRNIMLVAESKSNLPSLTPISDVLSEQKKSEPKTSPEPTAAISKTSPTAAPKATVTVKVDDPSAFVNIREKPSTESAKLGEAYDGDTFELVTLDSGWYEVKLADGSNGFVSEQYAVRKEAKR